MKPHGLSASERIKRKKDFEKIFSAGTTFISSDKKLKVTFYFDRKSERSDIQAAFAVHKKAGKAVWRNRARRLLREVYRLNKNIIYSEAASIKGRLLIVFSLYGVNQKKSKKIYLNDFMPPVIELMKKIKDRI